jgi:hypothetical protein
MKHVLTIGLLLSTATLFACAEEGDGSLETTIETTATGTSSTTVGTTSSTDGECKPGFEVGGCPDDIALPNSLGDLVSVHDQRGSRVVVLGSAEF